MYHYNSSLNIKDFYMVHKKVGSIASPVTVAKADILQLSDRALVLYMYYLSLPSHSNPTMGLATDYLHWSPAKYKSAKKELVVKGYIATKKHSIKGGGSEYDYFIGKVAVTNYTVKIGD